MNLRLLTTPWQRALGAMFRTGLGDSELVFLYPYSAPRLFHTFFCPPLRLTALSEDGEIIPRRLLLRTSARSGINRFYENPGSEQIRS